jgi:hypothetical protein
MKVNFWKLFALLSGLACIMFSLIAIMNNEYDKASTYIGMAILFKLNSTW